MTLIVKDKEVIIEDCKMNDQPINGVRTNAAATVHLSK